MAQIEEKGGGRNTNVDLNIVPFIDLMCVCIIFLLVTAVWTQVSMIQIGSSVYSKRTEATPDEPPPRPEVSFRLDVVSSGFVVKIGKKQLSIPKVNGAYDDKALMGELKTIKKDYPEKKDAVITVMEELTYDDLIHGMDMLLQGGFEEISVAAGGGAP
jgi:biopolymer transport protein TolR